jgi:acetyl esterase/lipase
MRRTVHSAPTGDLDIVATVLAAIAGSAGASADTGKALLAMVDKGTGTATDGLVISDWRGGSVHGRLVTVAGAGLDVLALYLHGRRFQHREPPEVFAVPLARALRMPVLLLEYRLAPVDPYPAALEDVLVAYRALLAQGRPPERIVIVGHSAGASLALSALLELTASRTPRPAGAVTVSPITDFTFSGASITANAGKDVISHSEAVTVREAYLADADPATSPASPLFGDPAGLPPLLMACGGDELLRDDTERFAARADAEGVTVELDVYEGMPHGFPLLPTRTASGLLARVAEFVDSRIPQL